MIYFAGPLEIMIDLAKAYPKICQCNDQLLNTKCNLTQTYLALIIFFFKKGEDQDPI